MTLNFLKPYYVQESSHTEFVNTSVYFDKQRADSGDKTYQNLSWQPYGEHEPENMDILRLAEPYFPSIHVWTRPALAKGRVPPDVNLEFLRQLRLNF